MSDPNQTPQQPAAPAAPQQVEPTDADLRSEAPPPGWAPGVWKRFQRTATENAALKQQVAELSPWKDRHAQDSQTWQFERAYYQAGYSDPEGLEVAKALWNAKPAEQRGEPSTFMGAPPKAVQAYRANTSPAQQAQPAAQQPQAPAAQPPQPAAPPPANPNGGAAQPAGAPGAQRYSDQEIARIRQANGGRLPPHVVADLAKDPSLGLKNLPTKAKG